MQFANYDAFRVALQHIVEGDDYASNTFSTDTLDLFVGLGEARVFNGDAQTSGLRASTMVKDWSGAVVSNAATLPSDLLQLKEVNLGGDPLEVIRLDELRRMENWSLNGGVSSAYCAQDGETLRFWPAATGTATGRYYSRPESLKTVTWANATTFARYPEIFLYAAAYEGALFLGLSGQEPLWNARYRALVDGANHSERMRVYGGSPLRIRSR